MHVCNQKKIKNQNQKPNKSSWNLNTGYFFDINAVPLKPPQPSQLISGHVVHGRLQHVLHRVDCILR